MQFVHTNRRRFYDPSASHSSGGDLAHRTRTRSVVLNDGPHDGGSMSSGARTTFSQSTGNSTVTSRSNGYARTKSKRHE